MARYSGVPVSSEGITGIRIEYFDIKPEVFWRGRDTDGDRRDR
jgi:hypothetical protein